LLDSLLQEARGDVLIGLRVAAAAIEAGGPARSPQ